MPQIGPLEILIVGVLALLVFGPEKLPEMGRSIGKGLAQFKRMASEVKSEFDVSLEEERHAPSRATEIEPRPASESSEPSEPGKAAPAA